MFDYEQLKSGKAKLWQRNILLKNIDLGSLSDISLHTGWFGGKIDRKAQLVNSFCKFLSILGQIEGSKGETFTIQNVS